VKGRPPNLGEIPSITGPVSRAAPLSRGGGRAGPEREGGERGAELRYFPSDHLTDGPLLSFQRNCRDHWFDSAHRNDRSTRSLGSRTGAVSCSVLTSRLEAPRVATDGAFIFLAGRPALCAAAVGRPSPRGSRERPERLRPKIAVFQVRVRRKSGPPFPSCARWGGPNRPARGASR